jgi:hypothetical protein
MTLFKTYLHKKIKQNMKEWKAGRWVSQKQALAVSYSQARSYMKNRRQRSKSLKQCKKSLKQCKKSLKQCKKSLKKCKKSLKKCKSQK